MDKSIYFFGQSVFGQLIKLIDFNSVQRLIRENGSDNYYKKFKTWDHMITMIFTVLSGCSSLREVAGAMLGLKGKIKHLQLGTIARRSTLSDANKNRNALVFEKIYYMLYHSYKRFLSDSRYKLQKDKNLYVIDSTVISLFKAILKCAGRRPASGKQKGGIKVHTLMNLQEEVPKLVWFTSGATNDVLFLQKIPFEKGNIYVFDRGYINYPVFEQMTLNQVGYVTRFKENTTYITIYENVASRCFEKGVLKDEVIELPIRKNGKILRVFKQRRIVYWDDQNQRIFEFLTNLFELDAEMVADIYKKRWEIELLFKQLKQNFPLKYFLGDNQNAITIQIWATLIVNLLLTVIRKQVQRHWSFSNIVSFCRLHLFNYIHLVSFLENPEKDWMKELIIDEYQLSIFTG